MDSDDVEEGKARNCLICGTSITRVHMGIDACRACAVFYRRASRSKFKIRCFSSGKCEQEGRLLECRRCRLDRMRRVIDRANLQIVIPTACPKTTPECEEGPSGTGRGTLPNGLLPLSRSITPGGSSTPVLDRIRCGYNVMARIRKSAELCMRPLDKFVHPSDIDDDSYLIINGRHIWYFHTMQILITALFDFASISFPEFLTLTKREKLNLIMSCYDRMNIIESTYRATKMFPNDERIFTSYTTTLSADSVDYFFSDCSEHENVKEAKDALRKNLNDTAGMVKRAMRRTDPADEEFLAMLAIAFWNNGTDDERLNEMGTTYKNAIMRELRAFYSTRQMANYAPRIGQLFCLLVTNEEVTSLILQDMELFRLMGIHQPPVPFCSL